MSWRTALAASCVLVAGAGAGVWYGTQDDGTGRPAALSPTSTLPATGCRFPDGARGPCDKGSAFCEATNTRAPNCDIDGQPRIDRNPSQGCATNTIPDAGADEFYAPGCEPLIGATTTNQTTTSPTTPTTVTTTPTQPAIEQAYHDFKAALPQASLYVRWKAANPGEAGRLDAYIGAVDHGMSEAQSPPPQMATATGRMLVAAVHERQVGQ